MADEFSKQIYEVHCYVDDGKIYLQQSDVGGGAPQLVFAPEQIALVQKLLGDAAEYLLNPQP